MPLVTLSEILKDAHARRYGIAMFDVHNLEMTSAVVEAAELERSPVIIALAEVHAKTLKTLQELAKIIVHAAENAAVPVCAHFDHGVSQENCLMVMRLGFSSVMYDGSMFPCPENVEKTARIVELASAFGASTEGELGHVGSAEGGEGGEEDTVFTDPAQAGDFVQKTGIDALAVSIGTAHGFYKNTPKLNLDILRAIRAQCPVPLVLHGGSGLSDRNFSDCIQGGISKINIYTGLAQIALECIANSCRRIEQLNYRDLMLLSVTGMTGYAREKMRLFGSSGRAE